MEEHTFARQMATSGLGVVSVVSCRLCSCRRRMRIASNRCVEPFKGHPDQP
jgi:hypothetical protein